MIHVLGPFPEFAFLGGIFGDNGTRQAEFMALLVVPRQVAKHESNPSIEAIYELLCLKERFAASATCEVSEFYKGNRGLWIAVNMRVLWDENRERILIN